MRDNGAGLTGGALEALEKGIGLSNTRARLQCLYPDDHHLEFSNPAGGLTVRIVVRFRQFDAGQSHAVDTPRWHDRTTDEIADHALKAFDVHALDYILKPFDRVRFQQALQRGRDQLQQRFFRIHRSRIVNMERIQELQPCFTGEYRVLLRNGTTLTLSRGHREKLHERLGRPF